MFEPGEASTFEALGKTWTLAPLSARAIRQFGAWIAGRVDVRGRLDTAHRFADKLPEQARALLDEALTIQKQLENFSPACPLAKEFLADPMGLTEFVLILLRPAHGAEANEDNIFDILRSGGKGFADALARVQGKAPGGPEGNV